jgi:hypothetical protein
MDPGGMGSGRNWRYDSGRRSDLTLGKLEEKGKERPEGWLGWLGGLRGLGGLLM